MIKQHHIITIALGSGLIFLMLAGASNFLAVQQHIVKAQSTPPAANPKGCVPACGAPGRLPTNTTGTQNPMNFTAPTGAPGNPLANTTVTQHLPNFNPPITQHCGNKYTSCG
jgi:hypothetical protein